ncbi:hypothetical protein NliqN6_1553 [Naganishia liquefaciens]|uniref:Uncharacterized protein n=1 Tax=Naganishia liquefaciens TaxID=104408 RepID=A0A8H3YEX6_9TREE|nr:hypothetical protein NliqN6_1553 [Naganishia liquefaciens]
MDDTPVSQSPEQARVPPAAALAAVAASFAPSTPSAIPPHIQSSFGGPSSPYAYSPSSVTSSRRRGRPRKYHTPEDRLAEKNRRRRERERARKAGEDPVDVPPRPANYTAPKPYDRDYGKYDIADPEALTARDVVVDWLAENETYIKWLQASTFMDKAVLTKQIQDKLKEHGMLERDASSLRQHIGILMKGCEDAKRFETDGTSTNIPISDTKRFNYLLSTGISQEEAYIRFRWPYYQKLKHLAKQVTVPPPPVYIQPPPTSIQPGNTYAPRPAPPQQSDTNDFSQPMDFDDNAMNVDHSWDDNNDNSASPPPGDFSARSATTRTPVKSSASQLTQTTSQTLQSAAARAEMLAIERERWELEKQQARQKLELEKEQLRRNDRIQEQEAHIALVKMFRSLIADGLSKNQAGRVVWRDTWQTMKAEMEQEDA